MNPNQALGLPERSVRAILAVIVVGTSAAMILMNREVPPWWQVAFGGAFGSYFVTRMLDTGSGPPTTTQAIDLLEQVRGIKP